MDKILGIGNSLVDVLLKMEDDSLLAELKLPKGSMQLIDEEMLTRIQHIPKIRNYHSIHD
jgi:hypothetical protein